MTISHDFTPQPIAFIGAGNMTQAIIKGMVAGGYPSNLIMATNPSRTKLDELTAATVQKTSQNP